MLATTVKRLCRKAGISGYKTNHSLRVTAATRLFREGLDEQLIITDHVDLLMQLECIKDHVQK